MTPAPGTYQLRLFQNGSTSNRLAASSNITVVPQPSVTTNGTTTGRGFSVTVSWNNQLNPTPSDFFAVYSQGSPDSSYIDFEYVNCTKTAGAAAPTGSCPYAMPLTPGTYDVRFFGNGSVSNRLAASASIS